MPSTLDHLKAIKRAKDAGDIEAAQYITQQMVNEANPIERGALGAVYGMGNIAQNVGNIVGLVDNETIKKHEKIAKPLLETTAGKVGQFAGETLATALPISGGAGLLARGSGTFAKMLSNPVARGAAEGLIGGGITGGPDNRIAGATMGAVGGAAVPALGAAYRGARSGVRPTAAAQQLMAQGVELTPGQMNPTGTFGQLEEVSKALPVVGPRIAAARQNAWNQTQNAVAQQAAPPGISVKSGKTLNDTVGNLKDAYETAYSSVKGFPISSPSILRTTGPDIPLSKAFDSAVRGKTNAIVTDQDIGAVNRFLKNQLTAFGKGNVKSEDLLSVRSNIRAARRDPNISMGADEILQKAEDSVTQALESHLPPQATQGLRNIDNQYGKFKIFEKAVGKGGDKPEGFTPFQLSQAVKESADKGEYAAGGGRLRGMSQASADVFQTTQPPTGRQLATLLPLAGGAYGMLQNPLAGVAALGGMGAMYGTQTGRRLAAGQTGLQLGARDIERELRRKIPAGVRKGSAAAMRMAAALEAARKEKEQEQ
jgi:hypothetical protein